MTATQPTHVRAASRRRGEPFAEFERAERRLLDRYGVEATSGHVDIPALGIGVHTLVAGDGPPVVMAIGGGMVAALWAPLMAHLNGHRLIAFDPPGHGLSDAVPYNTGDLRPMAIRLFDGLLDGLGLDRAPIVAQSMGGLWSTWFATARPDRVASISYIGCPALMLGTSAPLPLRISTIRPVGRLLDRLQPPSPKQVELLGRMAGEPLGELPEVRDMFLAYERLPSSGSALLDLHRAAVRARGARPEVALTADQLRSVVRPVQLVWGEHDPFGPPDVGRRAADIMPDAEFHLVGGGHGPWFTQSATIGPLVSDFLSRRA
jgi:2-hydroxy-6-oxonona-2,4-dienedioate hydrolase